MPIIKNIKIDEDTQLAIWEIKEDYDTLYRLVSLTLLEEETLKGFKSDKRQLEWLSVRALINEMLQANGRITYNADRKPFLNDGEYNISISHSNEFTSILISKSKRVGIDLEFMSHKIKNVADKFINEKEVICQNQLKRCHLYIHWCVKEAIYKICDKQDINFKENIVIEPFEPEKEGVIKATLNNIHGEEHFVLNYQEYQNYIIAWTVK